MRLAPALRHNLGLKLLSLALALFLWFFVHGSRVVEREVWLPIHYVHLPDSLMFLSDPPREVRVQLSGPAQDLALRHRALQRAEMQVDLARAGVPVHHVVPSVADVVLPAKARYAVDRILEPVAMDLHIDRRIHRSLRVRPVLTGDVAAGYCVAREPHAEPATVDCRGAASVLLKLGEVATRPVDLEGQQAPFTRQVDLAFDGRLVACDPSFVEVDVEVEKLRTRALLDAPLTILRPPGADVTVDVRPPHASVRLTGPQRHIDALDPADVALVLDLSALEPGVYSRMPVEPRLPEWAKLDSLEPRTVDVTIRRALRRRR